MQLIKNKHELFMTLKPLLGTNPLIIEAGAFDGKDTLSLSACWPQGTIHAFEPVPSIFRLLRENTKNYPNIQCHPRALAAQTGSAPFYCAQNPKKPNKECQAGSLLKPQERLSRSPIIYPIIMYVPTITLDAWAMDNAIDHLDFLWLDVQGMALPILQASPRMIKTLKALWVEVEFIQAYEGQRSYQEIVEWLQAQGFTIIARDFADKPHYFFGNILCVRK